MRPRHAQSILSALIPPAFALDSFKSSRRCEPTRIGVLILLLLFVAASEAQARGLSSCVLQELHARFGWNTPEEVRERIKIIRHRTEDDQKTAVFQNTFRSLDNYLLNFSGLGDFKSRIAEGRKRRDFHWFDSGGGSGKAVSDAYFGDGLLSIPGPVGSPFDHQAQHSLFPTENFRGTVLSYDDLKTYWMQMTPEAYEKALTRSLMHQKRWDAETARKYHEKHKEKYEAELKEIRRYQDRMRLIESDHDFKYISGKFLQDLETIHEDVDLLTDFYGPFAYMPNKLHALKAYSKMLRDRGAAFIELPHDIYFKTASGRKINIKDFLKRAQIPGLSIQKYKLGEDSYPFEYILLEKDPRTTEALDRLMNRIHTVEIGKPNETKMRMPPPFLYHVIY